MPRVRRVALRYRGPATVSEAMCEYLGSGCWFGFLGGRNDPEPTTDEACQAWCEASDQIMAEHIAEHPKTRPWGWWAFEAPEPRRRLDRRERPGRGELWFGVPKILSELGDFEAVYESESEYLARLGLLQNCEV